jgi:hypothetical protein
VTQPAGTIFVLRSGDLTGAVIRLITHSRVNHAGVCLGGGAIEVKMRGAVTGREHTGAPLWHQAAGRDGTATPRRRG